MAPDPVDAVKTWLQSAPQEVRDHVMSGMESSAQSAHPGHKTSKSDANYRPSDSETESCSMCVHFDGQGSCEVVAGNIKPDYVSDHFSPKDTSNDSSSSDSSAADSSADG